VSNFPPPRPSTTIVANRFVSAILVLSFVGVCFSYQVGDTGLTRGKQDDKPIVVGRMSSKIPTPEKDECVVIFESGDHAVVKIGQLVSMPSTEKFRGIWGESVTLVFDEKGATSGNNIWKVARR